MYVSKKYYPSPKESNLFGGEIEKTNEGYGLAKLATAKLTEICNSLTQYEL